QGVATNSSVIEEDVDPAEQGYGAIDGFFNGDAVANVRGERETLGADLAAVCRETLQVFRCSCFVARIGELPRYIERTNLATSFGEGQSRGPPLAVGGTGDECDSTFQTVR